MQNFHKHYNVNKTSQTQPIPGREAEMQTNPSGGVNYAISDYQFLLRFLITGAGEGAYAVGNPSDLACSLRRLRGMVSRNGLQIIEFLKEFSQAGRAPKNDPALYVLALCGAAEDEKVRQAALSKDTVSAIVRTGTHLFTFVEYLLSLRGGGKTFRRGVGSWYDYKDIRKLTYQVLKYRSRGVRSHSDVIRISHPSNPRSSHQTLYRYLVHPEVKENVEAAKKDNPLVDTFLTVQDPNTPKEQVIHLLRKGRIPWEFLPTKYLSDADIWEELLPSINMGALLRNLGKLGSIGLLKAGSPELAIVVAKLSDEVAIKNSRLHPFNILNALATYTSGGGVLGSLTWDVEPAIVDVLDGAFYKAFGNVEPTGKRFMISLDVSGSMDMYQLSSNRSMTARVGAMAMAMVTLATEENTVVNGFSHEMVNLDISPRRRLDDNIRAVHNIPFGRTDCALPMLTALRDGLDIDTFVIYTDNETWCGDIHPSQALRDYRKKTGIDAKLIVVAMTGKFSSGSIADPKDPGMLDVLGFDTSTPQVISEFAGM